MLTDARQRPIPLVVALIVRYAACLFAGRIRWPHPSSLLLNLPLLVRVRFPASPLVL